MPGNVTSHSGHKSEFWMLVELGKIEMVMKLGGHKVSHHKPGSFLVQLPKLEQGDYSCNRLNEMKEFLFCNTYHYSFHYQLVSFGWDGASMTKKQLEPYN